LENSYIEHCTSLKDYVQSLIKLHSRDNIELCQFLDVIDCKRRSKVIVSKLGLRCPETHMLVEDFEKFKIENLPNQFVVKPCWGSSNRGISICKIENKFIVDLHTNIKYTAKEFLNSYFLESKLFSRYSKEFTIEERIFSGTSENIFPLDYKVYTANGRAICFMQRDVNLGHNSTDWRYRYWLRNGIPIKSVNSKLTFESTLELPDNWGELISMADKIAQYFPIPFLRVDLFLNENGAYFCELTPKPGTYKTYNPDFDAFIGRQINKALPWQIEDIHDFLDAHRDLIW